MGSQAQHLDALGRHLLQKPFGITRQQVRIPGIAAEAIGHLRPATGAIIDGVNLQVGLEPAGAGDRLVPLGRGVGCSVC